MSTDTYHGLIASAKMYCGDGNLSETVHWQSLGRDGADMLVDSDGKLVTLTIIRAIVNDKLIAGPLGNFQSQEDNFSRSDNKMRCDQAKLVVVIGTPSQFDHPEWAQDFETAMKNLKEIQETVAKSKPNAPHLHFLDLKTGNVRFTHALWEKKSTQDDEENSDHQHEDNLDPSDDELMKTIQSRANDQAKATAKYGSTVSPKLKPLFKDAARGYDIKQPTFSRLKNGADIAIPLTLYQTRLENALVEITFCLRHYYLTHQKNHSFSASIQTLRVLSPRELLTSQANMAVPAKRKTTDTADDGDDEQSSPKKGEKRECGAGNDGPGSSTTKDENDEHSQILETLKDDNANDNHSV